MMNAASTQGVEIGKEKLREFLKDNEMGRQALGMQGRDHGDSDGISLNTLDSRGKRASREEEEEEEI